MPQQFVSSQWLRVFGVSPEDPGFIYIVRSGARLKIGRSKHKETRLKQAKTWLPDIKVVGVKPFWSHSRLENYLHQGLAAFWYKGEWYEFEGDEFEEWFLEEFSAFSDTDINSNSIDFIYVMNSTGLGEFTREFSERTTSKRKFLREQSSHSAHQSD